MYSEKRYRLSVGWANKPSFTCLWNWGCIALANRNHAFDYWYIGFAELNSVCACPIYIVELKQTHAVPISTLLPNAHPKSLRLLQKMLRWNPSERISVESALKDLYLNNYHNPTDEPVCTKQLDFTFDEDQVAIGVFVTFKVVALWFCLCSIGVILIVKLIVTVTSKLSLLLHDVFVESTYCIFEQMSVAKSF